MQLVHVTVDPKSGPFLMIRPPPGAADTLALRLAVDWTRELLENR